MAKCDGVEFKIKMKPGLYSSGWFFADDAHFDSDQPLGDTKAEVIRGFVLKYFDKQACTEGDCGKQKKGEKFPGCGAISLSVTVPEGAGAFKKATTEDPGGGVLECYLLKLKVESEITGSTKCDCLDKI